MTPTGSRAWHQVREFVCFLVPIDIHVFKDLASKWLLSDLLLFARGDAFLLIRALHSFEHLLATSMHDFVAFDDRLAKESIDARIAINRLRNELLSAPRANNHIVRHAVQKIRQLLLLIKAYFFLNK